MTRSVECVTEQECAPESNRGGHGHFKILTEGTNLAPLQLNLSLQCPSWGQNLCDHSISGRIVKSRRMDWCAVMIKILVIVAR